MLLLLFLLLAGFFGYATAGPAVEPGPAPALPTTGAENSLSDLTIRNWACPVAYTGANYAQDCDTPVTNLEFAIVNPISQSGLTDAGGVISFVDLPAGTYDVSGGPPGEFVQNAVTCFVTDLERLALPYFPRDNRTIAVTLVDTDITCDWFSIPYDLRGDG